MIREANIVCGSCIIIIMMDEIAGFCTVQAFPGFWPKSLHLLWCCDDDVKVLTLHYNTRYCTIGYFL